METSAPLALLERAITVPEYSDFELGPKLRRLGHRMSNVGDRPVRAQPELPHQPPSPPPAAAIR